MTREHPDEHVQTIACLIPRICFLLITLCNQIIHQTEVLSVFISLQIFWHAAVFHVEVVYAIMCLFQETIFTNFVPKHIMVNLNRSPTSLRNCIKSQSTNKQDLWYLLQMAKLTCDCIYMILLTFNLRINVY
jgi:hypothetical protein